MLAVLCASCCAINIRLLRIRINANNLRDSEKLVPTTCIPHIYMLLICMYAHTCQWYIRLYSCSSCDMLPCDMLLALSAHEVEYSVLGAIAASESAPNESCDA